MKRKQLLSGSIIFSVGGEITSTIFIYKKPVISSIIKLHTKI